MRKRPENFRDHVAVFGGAFDPPHLSHVDAAKALLKNPGVKRVIVMPSWGTPLKSNTRPFASRLAMTRVAFAGIDRLIEVSDIEEQIQCQFSWQLIERLKTEHPKIAFVIGSDQVPQLSKWAKYPEVLDLCDWIVLARQGHPIELPLPDHMVRVNTPAPEVSSTKIREALALNQAESIKPLLPKSVWEYIQKNRTYEQI